MGNSCASQHEIPFYYILKLTSSISFLPGSQLRHIIEDSAVEVDSSSPDFWILVAALKVNFFYFFSGSACVSWDLV